MHTDEGKRFDRRNVEANFRRGVLTQKEWETYLAKLPDVSEKIYDSEEESDKGDSGATSVAEHEKNVRKKGVKAKARG